ncbi:MAG: hypothetical protein JWP37_317 [Mucilaginibacter sp.]|nr:hypothetical protein [Mucilaginibacter sp.]
MDIDWPAWIQAGSSVFAAIGLVWTLMLQRRSTDAQIVATNTQNDLAVQQLKEIRAQIEMSKTDHQRFLKEIRPVIKCSVEETNDLEGKVKMVVTANPVYDFFIKVPGQHPFVLDGLLAEPTFFNVETEFALPYKITANPPQKNVVGFLLTYKDEIGTSYSQIFWQDANGKLNNDIPVINTDKSGTSALPLPVVRDIYKDN